MDLTFFVSTAALFLARPEKYDYLVRNASTQMASSRLVVALEPPNKSTEGARFIAPSSVQFSKSFCLRPQENGRPWAEPDTAILLKAARVRPRRPLFSTKATTVLSGFAPRIAWLCPRRHNFLVPLKEQHF